MDVIELHFKVTDFIGPVPFQWHIGNIGILVLYSIYIEEDIKRHVMKDRNTDRHHFCILFCDSQKN